MAKQLADLPRFPVVCAALLLSAVIGSVPAFFWIPQHYQWVLFLDAALPLLIVVPLVLVFVPESPRWLAAKGRFDQADRTVKKWEDKASRNGQLPQPQAVEATVTEKVPTRELFTGTYGLLLYVWGFGRLSRLRPVSGARCQLRSMNFRIEAWSL